LIKHSEAVVAFNSSPLTQEAIDSFLNSEGPSSIIVVMPNQKDPSASGQFYQFTVEKVTLKDGCQLLAFYCADCDFPRKTVRVIPLERQS